MADIIVTTLADEYDGGATVAAPGGDGLSLREAIALAGTPDYADFDSIRFAPTLSGVIRLTNESVGTLGVISSLGIYGEGRITISGDVAGDDTVVNGFTDIRATAAENLDDNVKLFGLAGPGNGVSVTLDGLNLTGGRAGNYGGAVDAYGTDLTINNVNMIGNSFIDNPDDSYSNGGGAIYTDADLTVTNSTFAGNTMQEGTGGGAIFDNGGGTIRFTNTTFVNNAAYNAADDAKGGAVFSNYDSSNVNTDRPYFRNVTITGNYAEGNGGGIYVTNATAIDSIFVGNKAGGVGDDLDFSEIFGSGGLLTTDDVSASEVFIETSTFNGAEGGVLALHSGTVLTVGLNRSLTNPAVDAGFNGPAQDARGEAAIDDPFISPINASGFRDIGAHEKTEFGSFVVTTLDDTYLDDGQTSLREAVAFANQSAGANTISFANGLSGVIRLTNGQLDVTDALTVEGGGAITITGDANGDDILQDEATYGNAAVTNARASYSAQDNGATTQNLEDNTRIFAATADLTLEGLVLTGGSSGFDGPFSSGGAVQATGDAALTVRDSLIAGNIQSGFSRDGGGLYTETGALSVYDSTIAGNVAWRDGVAGAGVASNGGEILLSGTTVTNNAIGRSGGAQAGGVYSYGGNVTITANSVISNNQSGIYDGVSAQGGGIHVANANLTVTDSLIFGNQTFNSSGEGGGVYVGNGDFTATDSKIYGNGAGLSEEGGGTSSSAQGGGVYVSGGDVTLTRVEVTDNYTAGDDGPSGGGLFVNSGGTLIITDSLFSSNEIRLSGAGGGNGGGVNFDGASVVISGSDFVNNRVFSDTGDGGGLALRADTISITNSDITGNSVYGDFRASGGGLSAEGAVTLTNVSVGYNQATGELSTGGGVYIRDGALIVNGGEIRGNLAAGGDNDGDRYDQDATNFGGGGIYATGSVALNGASIIGNATTGAAGRGAGIKAQGDISVIGSTVANNTAQGPTSHGAGIYSDGAVEATNSTFVGNRGYDYGSRGGAIYAGTNVTLTHVTITGNGVTNSANTGGGVYFNGAATVANSIILGNNASFGGGELDRNANTATVADVTFSGQNIVGATSDDFDTTGFTNVINASAFSVFTQISFFEEEFGILSDNGGPVQTVALFGAGSNPALDAAATGGSDARGFARVDLPGANSGGVADLGAFEFQTGDDIAPPSFTSVPSFTVGETLLAGLNFVPVTVNDLTAVTFSIDGGPDAGAVSIDAVTGVLSFNGPVDFENPTDANGDNRFEFTIRATDEAGNFSTDVTTITITDVNEAPVAAAATASGDEDTVISGALTASDVDGDALTFTQVTGPSNGTLTITADGGFTFTPVADFNGTDSFTFRANDGALSDTATATITVNPVDDPVAPPAPTGPTQGDDTLLGTALNDTINALAGNDNVNGLAGDDLLIGGGGNDSIKGAAGDDRLRGNGGDDTVKGGGGNDNLKGNGGADVIRGNGGDDVIRAGGGEDNVKGGGGADLIFGGGGADRLNGGGGADTIRGNGGDDTLKGNGGADVFQFRASDRNDTISDFRQGQDKIQIQSGANSFEGLDIVQDGRDVLIGFGAGQVRVVTDNAGAFDENDFIF